MHISSIDNKINDRQVSQQIRAHQGFVLSSKASLAVDGPAQWKHSVVGFPAGPGIRVHPSKVIDNFLGHESPVRSV